MLSRLHRCVAVFVEIESELVNPVVHLSIIGSRVAAKAFSSDGWVNWIQLN
jgi:hypothetical protein